MLVMDFFLFSFHQFEIFGFVLNRYLACVSNTQGILIMEESGSINIGFDLALLVQIPTRVLLARRLVLIFQVKEVSVRIVPVVSCLIDVVDLVPPNYVNALAPYL